MFGKIFAKKVDMPDGEGPANGGTAVELSWGWTACMTEEEVAELADDCPQGHDSVLTTLDMLTALRDDLNKLIEEGE